MKAVIIRGYGTTDVLQYEDWVQPQIKPDQLLVKVHASSVNPIDWKIRKGMLSLLVGNRLPLILGFDVGGEVVKVGSQVTRFQPGDAIYGSEVLIQGFLSLFLPGQKAKLVIEQPNSKDLIYLKDLIAVGKIRAVIDRTYPLQEVAAAHGYSESERAVGKIAIAVAS